MSSKSIAAERREKVARLHLRGITIRQIAEIVGREIVNPQTGKPYSHVTIYKDLQVLSDQWQESAVKTITEHKARLLAELQEVKRMAWENEDLHAILRAIDRESKLLGTDAPQTHRHEGEVTQNIQYVEIVKSYEQDDVPHILQ